MPSINQTSNINILSWAIQDLAGKKIDLETDPFAKNNKVVRFVQLCLNFISTGKYGQSLHEKREAIQGAINELKENIRHAIMDPHMLDSAFQYHGKLPEFEVTINERPYRIAAHSTDGGLSISEGYDEQHGQVIPDVSFSDLVNFIYDEEELKNSTLTQHTSPHAEAQPFTGANPAMERSSARVEQNLADIIGTEENNTGQYKVLQEMAGPLHSDSPFINDLRSARVETPVARETLITAPDGNRLPANCVYIDQKPVGITSQYPLSQYLDSNLKMLADKKPSVLVVLTSDQEMTTQGLPDFFSRDGVHGDVTVKTQYQGDKHYLPYPSDLSAHNYQITVTDGDGKPVTIPVIHVYNWNEYAAQNAETLAALAENINASSQQSVERYIEEDDLDLGGADKMLPMVMSTTGGGRCGEVLAACELLDDTRNDSLQTIISDVRESSNYTMVNNRGQVNALTQLARRMNRPISNDNNLSPQQETVLSQPAGSQPARVQTAPEINPATIVQAAPVTDSAAMATPASDRQLLAQMIGTKENAMGQYRDFLVQSGSSASDSLFINDLPGARFPDAGFARHTLVTSPDGTPLPANHVYLNKIKVATAAEHPTATHLNSQLKSIMQQKPSVLVIMTSDQEMAEGLPDFFSRNGQYGDITIQSRYHDNSTYPDSLESRNYRITLTDQAGQSSTVLVKHIYNWNPLAEQSIDALREIADDINQINNDTAIANIDMDSADDLDPLRLKPMFISPSCSGSCGELIAACQIMKPAQPRSLQQIITDMRISSNPGMVSTPEQLNTLMALAAQNGVDLVPGNQPT